MASPSSNMPGEHSGSRIASLDAYQQPDYLQQLLDMVNQSAPDFLAQAKAQLDPAYQAQLAAINNAKGSSKKQAAYSDAQLAAMYKALGIDVGKNAKNINNIFNQGYNSVNSAYDTGARDVANTFNQTQSDMQAMMAKYGLSAAAPEALRQSNTNEALMNSIMASNKQAANNSLGISRAGDLAFNAAQQNIAGLEGTNRRADLSQLLQRTLAGYDQQALQASGNYNSQLAQRQQELQSSYLQQLGQQQNLAYTAYNDQMNRQVQQQQQSTPSLQQQWQMMGPVDKGYYQASQLFGPQNAGNAVQLVMQVGADPKNLANGFSFVQAVLAHNEEIAKSDPAHALDPQQLSALASFMFDQISPRYNPYTAG